MSKQSATQRQFPSRLKFFELFMLLVFFGVLSRLFYWQIIKSPSLKTIATNQYSRNVVLSPKRGQLFTSDGYLLVGNQKVYRLFLEPQVFSQDQAQVKNQLLPIILSESLDYQEASTEADQKLVSAEHDRVLTEKLSTKAGSWINLKNKLSVEARDKIESLSIPGLGFDEYYVRDYPEASMAAHVTGFVGKNEAGADVGYFGVEGALDQELRGYQTSQLSLKDALGFNLLGSDQASSMIDGRDVTLTIRRDVQQILEEELQQGVEQYGAKSGEAIVIETGTGKIRGLATWPHYDQAQFYKYEPDLYKNPSLSNLYEPGSTFKVLTMAMGIDLGVISPDTTCTRCDGPRTIDKFTIKTWNEEYHPDITMTDALKKSDNIALIFAAEEIGSDEFQNYLDKFKLYDSLQIDLQEDEDSPKPIKWGPVELATRSFGQGLSLNSLQLVRAVNSLANQGVMVNPTIIESVYDPASQKQIEVKPQEGLAVIKPETAQKVTQMMVAAAPPGESKRAAQKNYDVAGKSGTAQIAGDSGYQEGKVIASFIGFSPADKPKFTIYVKLVEPAGAAWGDTTAAPIWYRVANRLHLVW